MSKKIFFNCTQHELTADQKKEISLQGMEILELKDVDRGLYASLSKSPSELESLEKLATRLADLITIQMKKYKDVFVHLPIGSPCFMFIFAQKCLLYKFKILFSHTERECVETKLNENEVKREYIFKFKKFIEV